MTRPRKTFHLDSTKRKTVVRGRYGAFTAERTEEHSEAPGTLGGGRVTWKTKPTNSGPTRPFRKASPLMEATLEEAFRDSHAY